MKATVTCFSLTMVTAMSRTWLMIELPWVVDRSGKELCCLARAHMAPPVLPLPVVGVAGVVVISVVVISVRQPMERRCRCSSSNCLPCRCVSTKPMKSYCASLQNSLTACEKVEMFATRTRKSLVASRWWLKLRLFRRRRR